MDGLRGRSEAIYFQEELPKMNVAPRFGSVFSSPLPAKWDSQPGTDAQRCAKVIIDGDIGAIYPDCDAIRLMTKQKSGQSDIEREKQLIWALLGDPEKKLPINREMAQQFLSRVFAALGEYEQTFTAPGPEKGSSDLRVSFPFATKFQFGDPNQIFLSGFDQAKQTQLSKVFGRWRQEGVTLGEYRFDQEKTEKYQYIPTHLPTMSDFLNNLETPRVKEPDAYFFFFTHRTDPTKTVSVGYSVTGKEQAVFTINPLKRQNLPDLDSLKTALEGHLNQALAS
jgi:hypothetical protein